MALSLRFCRMWSAKINIKFMLSVYTSIKGCAPKNWEHKKNAQELLEA